jgi:precorrin-4 methylase
MFSSINYTVKLLRAAYEDGLDTISVMSMSDSELFKKLLEALKLLKEQGIVFQVAPCISIPLKLGRLPY